jgi:TctA family transporter
MFQHSTYIAILFTKINITSRIQYATNIAELPDLCAQQIVRICCFIGVYRCNLWLDLPA